MSDKGPGGAERFRWQDFKGIDPNQPALYRGPHGGFLTHLRRMFASLLRLARDYHEERD